MKLAGCEVKNITKNSASLGNTEVTREELLVLLNEMDCAPRAVITIKNSSDSYYLVFKINRDCGWISTNIKSTSDFSATQADFCLNKEIAQQLRDFLVTELVKRNW